MYFYSIGYYSHGDSGYKQLAHDKKFSKEEFEEIIFKSVPFVIEKIKEDMLKPFCDQNYDCYYDAYHEILTVRFEAIYNIIACALVENFEFKHLQFAAKFHLFGLPNMMIENDLDNEEDELYKALSEKIREGLQNIEMHPEHYEKFEDDE